MKVIDVSVPGWRHRPTHCSQIASASWAEGLCFNTPHKIWLNMQSCRAMFLCLALWKSSLSFLHLTSPVSPWPSADFIPMADTEASASPIKSLLPNSLSHKVCKTRAQIARQAIKPTIWHERYCEKSKKLSVKIRMPWSPCRTSTPRFSAQRAVASQTGKSEFRKEAAKAAIQGRYPTITITPQLTKFPKRSMRKKASIMAIPNFTTLAWTKPSGPVRTSSVSSFRKIQ